MFPIGSNYSKDCPDQTGIDGNFSLDPEYCGVDDSGNYFLQSGSPCAPGNHPAAHLDSVNTSLKSFTIVSHEIAIENISSR